MDHQRINRNATHRHDDWDEVHQQLIEVQEKNAVQKKSLAISNPGDADEKEADEVARKVTGGESAQVHGTGGTINRKGEGAAETSPEFQSKLESSKGGGQSLPENLQQEMGSKMGADFSGVKVHTGGEAHSLNESVNAKAFAHGNDVYFREGAYNPESTAGKELLAHELVHTVQQSGTASGLIQREIDQKGSIRIIQNRLGFETTGDRSNIPSKDWPNDLTLLNKLFGRYMGESLANVTDALAAIKTDVPDHLGKLDTALIALQKLIDKHSNLYDITTTQQVKDVLKDMIDVDPALYENLKKDEVDMSTFSKEHFDWDLDQSKAGYEDANRIGLIVNNETVKINQKDKIVPKKSGDTMEKHAMNAHYYLGLLDKELPKSMRGDNESIFDLYDKHKGQQVLNTTVTYKSAPSLILQLKDNLAVMVESSKFNSSPKSLAPQLQLLAMVFHYYLGYKYYVDQWTKQGDELKNLDEGTYRKQRAKERIAAVYSKDEGKSTYYQMQELITLVMDFKDIDLDEKNIANVHYDERTNNIITATDIDGTSVDEAKYLKSEKLMQGDEVVGIVLFEKGGLKTVKLNIHAFDNAELLGTVLETASNKVAPPDATTNKKKGKKPDISKVKDDAFDIDGAVNSNKNILQRKTSIRTVQDLVGAPVTGIMDRDTVKYIYLWQKSGSAKGVITPTDIDSFFGLLKSAHSYNAAIQLTLDFYGLDEELLKLPETAYQLPGQSKGGTAPTTFTEHLMIIYYQQDAEPSLSGEAGVTHGYAGTAIPALVRIGIEAFSDASQLASTVAHELVHVRQRSGGGTESREAGDIFTYLTEVRGYYGTKPLPVVTPQGYVSSLEYGMGYYFQRPTVDELILYIPQMKEYVQLMNAHFKRISPNTYELKQRVDNVTMSTYPPFSFTQSESDAILMYESTRILEHSVGVVEAYDKLKKGDINATAVQTFTSAYRLAEGKKNKAKVDVWEYDSGHVFGSDYARYFTQDARVQKHYMVAKAGVDKVKNEAIELIQKKIDSMDKNDKNRKDLETALIELKTDKV